MMAGRQSGDEAAGTGRAWDAVMWGRLKVRMEIKWMNMDYLAFVYHVP